MPAFGGTLADRLGFLLEHFFAWTEVLFFSRDHGGYAFLDAFALCLCFFERVFGAWLLFIHAHLSGNPRAAREAQTRVLPTEIARAIRRR